jgi:hypothetical protein
MRQATKLVAGATVTALLPFEGHVDLIGTAADATVMTTCFELGRGGWQPWSPVPGPPARQH